MGWPQETHAECLSCLPQLNALLECVSLGANLDMCLYLLGSDFEVSEITLSVLSKGDFAAVKTAM